jgi:resolvase-like protein
MNSCKTSAAPSSGQTSGLGHLRNPSHPKPFTSVSLSRCPRRVRSTSDSRKITASQRTDVEGHKRSCRLIDGSNAMQPRCHRLRCLHAGNSRTFTFPRRRASASLSEQLSKDITMAATVCAAFYLRVLTGRQAESDLSIPDQRRQAKSYCASRGWEIAADYVEPGASATDDRRPHADRIWRLPPRLSPRPGPTRRGRCKRGPHLRIEKHTAPHTRCGFERKNGGFWRVQFCTEVATPAGFEPAAHSLEDRSIQSQMLS